MTKQRRAIREVSAIARALGTTSSLEDHELERELRRQPVHPGYVWHEGAREWRLRGEYVDIPKRFLAFATRAERAQESFASKALGDVDDRATVLGFEDGDALRAWMIARPERYLVRSVSRSVEAYSAANAREVKRILEKYSDEPVTIERARAALIHAIEDEQGFARDRSAGRMAKKRALAAATGKCSICGREDAREGLKTCYWCSYAASVRTARAREAKKSVA